MLSYLFTQTPLIFLVQSLWRDEAFSFLLAKHNPIKIILLTAKDFNPPLYYLLLSVWMKIFGSSEIALRSLSLIFFILLLFFSYLFMRRILHVSRPRAYVYLSFIAINPVLIYYAFEARMYMLLSFLVVASSYFFYKKHLRLYFVSIFLGLYTHYFMIFVAAFYFLFIYLTQHKTHYYHKITKIIFVSFILFLPWALFSVSYKQYASGFWLDPVRINTFLNIPGILYAGYEKSVFPSIFYTFFFSIGFFILMFITNKLIKHTAKEKKQIFLFLFLWSVGIPFVVALISFIKPIFFPRYLVFSSAGLLLFLIFIFEHLPKKISDSVFIALFLITLLYFEKIQIKSQQKDNVKKVAKEIKTLAKKDDVVYVTSELDFFTMQYYFAENRVLIYGKSHGYIPFYVGKVLIGTDKLTYTLPTYPKRAFVVNPNLTYTIQALY